MHYSNTKFFQRIKSSLSNCNGILEKMFNAKSPEEILILLDLCHFKKDDIDHLFLILLGEAILEVHHDDRLLEILIDLAENHQTFDSVFRTKSFWNICGMWIRKNYTKKDKTRFQKLSVLMGIGGRKANFRK
jgi:hypothetical protein